MTLPNKLSMSRILMVPFLLVAMLAGGPEPANPFLFGWFRLAALLMIIAGSITDWLDGKIARETGAVSNLGKLLDPLADKLFVATAFICLIDMEVYPAWPIVIILCREFLVTGLRSLAAAQGQVMAADKWGKHKTGWQLATIITALTFVTAREFLRAGGYWAPGQPLLQNWHADVIYRVVLDVLLLVAVVLTILSGTFYLLRNRQLLTDSS